MRLRDRATRFEAALAIIRQLLARLNGRTVVLTVPLLQRMGIDVG